MRYLISFLLILTALIANARQVTLTEAESIAGEYFNSMGVAKAKKAPCLVNRDSCVSGRQSDFQPYYVFNAQDNAGFIIVAGDTRFKKILGYSEKGSFDENRIPPQLSWLLKEYQNQIAEIPQTALENESWQLHTSASADGIFLPTANWGQGYPYNAKCPIIEGVKAPAGCVATAMAIVMKYHNWPERGNGKHTNFFNQNLRFDYENYKPNWAVMPQVLDSENLSNEQINEISTLCFSAGVATDMSYGPKESGAESLFVGNVMSSRFNFAPNSIMGRKDFSSLEWDKIIKTEIDNNRPIIYFGHGDVGHAFVIDGYDSNNLVHINWGWDGAMNGYFELSNLNVSGLDFSKDQSMIIGLQPNRSTIRYSSFMVNDGVGVFSYLKNDGFNFTTNRIKTNEVFGAVLPCVYGDFEETGLIGLAIVDSLNNIIELVGKNWGGANSPSYKYLDFPGASHGAGNNCEGVWTFECGDYRIQKKCMNTICMS